MGFAILWVISFHYSFLAGTPLGYFAEGGHLGVDIFVILSAFGLCFSLSKGGGYLHFIKKRVLRIVPTWWVLITAMLLVTVVLGRNNYPQSVFQYLCYYSGLGWWFYYDKHPGVYFYEWYIPTILLFYLFMPWLYRLSNRKLLLALLLSMAAGCLLLHFGVGGMLKLSFLRVPAFIYGIFLYRAYRVSQSVGGVKSLNVIYWVSSLVGVIGLLLLSFVFFDLRIAIQRYCFMLASPLLFSWAAILLGKLRLERALSFVGTLTLELYLLHIYNLPLYAVMRFVGNRTISTVVVTVLLIGVAYIVSKAVSSTMKKVKIARN